MHSRIIRTMLVVAVGIATQPAFAQSNQCMPEQAKGAVQLGGSMLAFSEICKKTSKAEVVKARTESVKQGVITFPCAAKQIPSWFDDAYKVATNEAKAVSPADIAAQCKEYDKMIAGFENMAKVLGDSVGNKKK